MMLVAMAHQSCEIERKMDQTVARLSEQFCDQVLQRSNLQAQPAVSVVNIGNGREYAPYYIDENDTFTYKVAKCNFRPIFRSRIVPGRIVACFMNNILLQPNSTPLQATWPDNRHKDEIWLAFDAAGEVNTLEDAMIAFCEGIQAAAPVDSYVTPEPWAMPGYDSDVIMAAGAFVQGSSIELSADGPVKPPYAVYFQGGLTWYHAKLGILMSLQKLYERDLVKID